jgi:hypothetical protein
MLRRCELLYRSGPPRIARAHRLLPMCAYLKPSISGKPEIGGDPTFPLESGVAQHARRPESRTGGADLHGSNGVLATSAAVARDDAVDFRALNHEGLVYV